MGRPARALLVSACVLLAGCGGLGGLDDDVREVGTTTSPTTAPTSTSGCLTPAEAAEREYPSKPAELNRTRAVAFVEEYHETHVWNRLVFWKDHGDYRVTEASVVETTETGYVVHVAGVGHFRNCEDGRLVHGEIAAEASYFVNGTVLVKAATSNESVDPRRTGTVVERWGGPEIPREPYPSPPGDLTNETAKEVAVEYEEARVHNSLRNVSGVNSVSVPGIYPPEATVVNRTDAGVYVEVSVSYSYGTDEASVDHPGEPALYLVNESAVRPVEKSG